MSAMQFICPFCTGLFEVEAGLIGHHVTCPTCGGIVLVAGASLPPDIPPPPPPPPGPGLVLSPAIPSPPGAFLPPVLVSQGAPQLGVDMMPPLPPSGFAPPPPPGLPPIPPTTDFSPPSIDDRLPPPVELPAPVPQPPTAPTPPAAPRPVPSSIVSQPATTEPQPRSTPGETQKSGKDAMQVDLGDGVARPAPVKRYRTPEERANRRIFRNLLWGFLSLIVLVIMAVILIRNQ